MPNYTHINLKDIEDMAVRYGQSPDLEARFAADPLGLERSGLSYQRMAPGFRMFSHRHREQEEVYVVLSGGGRIKLDDDVVELRPLDVVRMAPETGRAVEAGPDGLELLAFGAPRSAGESVVKDVERLPDPWGDDQAVRSPKPG